MKIIRTMCFVAGGILLYLSTMILERDDWWLGAVCNRTYHSWEDQLGRQEIPNDVIQNPTVFVVFHFYRRVNSN